MENEDKKNKKPLVTPRRVEKFMRGGAKVLSLAATIVIALVFKQKPK